ncbi:MAG: tRNA 2-thiouridine(34) synthase MnmA [bacterium]|nr:tRNA 2-thiouridine(34) synthase MnmA [bacterium]
MKKVACLMSGGVDSSVACAILKEQGFDVIGFTLKLWNDGSKCCDTKDIYDARRIADRLNIPHYLINMEKEFKENVIDYFVSEYTNGRTPNPCVVCNQKIKLGKFIEKMCNSVLSEKQNGIEFIATGHYAQVCHIDNRYILKKSKALLKDQSYFLAQLSQDSLAKVIFPLAGLKKTEVKQKAIELNLNLENKKESQEICFIPDNDHISFIGKYKQIEPGEITDKTGKVLGCHPGIPKYTIGQRKGIKLSAKNPLYVIEIDADKNRIIVGENNDLYIESMLVDNLNWISVENPVLPMSVSVKIRYNQIPVEAELLAVAKGMGHPAKSQIPSRRWAADILVKFNSPQRAVTPGQLAVFYKEDVVIGSGWIRISNPRTQR